MLPQNGWSLVFGRILFDLRCNIRIWFLGNSHLFDCINTNRKIKMFQNERFNLAFYRAGPFAGN